MVLAAEGWWSAETAQFMSALAKGARAVCSSVFAGLRPRGPAGGVPSSRQNGGTSEARRRCQKDRGRGHRAEVGGTHDGTTDECCCGSSDSAVPVRTFDASWHRAHRTHTHTLQLLTEENPRATVLSIVGIGAFDLISRKSVLEALMRVEGGPAIMPFVRLFYGQPSSYHWESDDGTVHNIEQSEGVERGDPLTPLLFALGQHTALSAIDNFLGAEDRRQAFVDEVYIVRVYGTAHSRIRIHEGKTQLWNSGGERPEFFERSNVSPKPWTKTLKCGEDWGCQPENRASECWRLRWGTLISWKAVCTHASKTTKFCWTGSRSARFAVGMGSPSSLRFSPGLLAACCQTCLGSRFR